ncbi:MAG: hypothetical protein QXR19_16965 [Candidatus Jordarchaeaceae archaeon]
MINFGKYGFSFGFHIILENPGFREIVEIINENRPNKLDEKKAELEKKGIKTQPEPTYIHIHETISVQWKLEWFEPQKNEGEKMDEVEKLVRTIFTIRGETWKIPLDEREEKHYDYEENYIVQKRFHRHELRKHIMEEGHTREQAEKNNRSSTPRNNRPKRHGPQSPQKQRNEPIRPGKRGILGRRRIRPPKRLHNRRNIRRRTKKLRTGILLRLRGQRRGETERSIRRIQREGAEQRRTNNGTHKKGICRERG